MKCYLFEKPTSIIPTEKQMKKISIEIKLTEGFQSSCCKPAAKEVIDLNGAKSSQIVRPPENMELNYSEIKILI